MFTFGLFSTHMPYVAMVVFYGLYFLFAAPGSVPFFAAQIDEEPDATEQLQSSADADNQNAATFLAASLKAVNHNIPPLRLLFERNFYAPLARGSCHQGLASAWPTRPPPFWS